jgi:hypothetical protein
VVTNFTIAQAVDMILIFILYQKDTVHMSVFVKMEVKITLMFVVRMIGRMNRPPLNNLTKGIKEIRDDR